MSSIELRHTDVVEQFGTQASWRETLQNALVITRREVRDSFRDWRIIIPIILLTLCFPTLANFASSLFIRLFERYGADSENLVEAFLPLMPMIVGFFPVSISLVIALETFVGEKERRSLEPLLSTPLTNTELYLGKVIAATLPPLLAAYLGITIYVSGQILGTQQWRPDIMLIVQIVVLTTIQAMVMVTGAVVVSSQTTSTRAANLLASTIILPMSLLVIFESFIMIQPNARYVLWYIAGGLVAVIILLIRAGARIFNREELLGRAVDTLDLRWAWGVIIEQFTGISHEDRLAVKAGEKTLPKWDPLRWYRRAVFPSLKTLRDPMIVVGIAIIGAFIFGWVLADRWTLPLDKGEYNDEALLDQLRNLWGSGDVNAITFVISQNMRVLLVAGILGLFTFGVMSIIVILPAFAGLGYILGNVFSSSINPLPFFIAIIPHGLVEVPAVLIAAAAALRAGSIVTHPPDEMTVGEAWLRAITDAIKIGIAVVFPLLVIAAMIEVIITPAFVEWALEIGF